MPTSIKNTDEAPESQSDQAGEVRRQDRDNRDNRDYRDNRDNPVQSVARQVIAGVEQSNQMTLNTLQAWVDSVSGFAPNLGLFPFADEWREATTANLEFARQLLDLQLDFTTQVFTALAPVGGRPR